MAVIAGVRNAGFSRKVRTGYPEAVVTTIVIAHIIPAGHMAVYALGTGTLDIFRFSAIDETSRAGTLPV